MGETPSVSLRAGVAAAVMGLAGLLAYGLLSKPTPVNGYVSVPWDGAPPIGVECMETSGEASAQAMSLFGYTDEPAQVVLVRVCAAPLDGGTLDTPQGMLAIHDTGEVFDFIPGITPQMAVWTQAKAPWKWACSTGVNCLEVEDDGGLSEARVGLTLPPGGWQSSDGGCLPMPHVFRTLPIWPAGCPK